MALSNFNLPIGVSERNNFDLSTQTLTTSDFFSPKVVYSHEFCPGESWKCNVSCMTRTIPLYKPIYSDLLNNVRFFFVPFRTIKNEFNDWINNTYSSSTTYETVIKTTTAEFLGAFLYNTIATKEGVGTYHNFSFVEDVGDSKYYDFRITVTSDTGVQNPTTGKYKFNKRGRFLYDILLGLGYQLQFGNCSYNFDENSASQTNLDDISFMPFLSYIKIQFDYYCNPLFTQYYTLSNILHNFFRRTNAGYQNVVKERIIDLFLIAENCNYEPDYFTSSWESPFGPQVGTTGTNPNTTLTGIDVVDPANPDAHVVYDNSLNEATVQNGNVSNDSITLSQYLDTALHKISNLFHRYNMTGVRAIDRYMSERGLKLDSAYANRCIYLGHRSAPFTVSDVTSTGDYDSLGDYKGKALNYNLNGNFEFSGNEFGMIIGISTVVPKFQYCQGMPRHIHHLNVYDFFTPSLDKLGVQPIRCDELWSRHLDSTKVLPSSDFGVRDSSVLGYSSMYAEYKCNPHCVRSGIFSLASQNGISMADSDYNEYKGLTQTWHLWRLFDDYERQGNYLRDCEDREQYDRIFDMVDGSVDGFIQVFNFKVKASLPMSKMFESYDFGDDEDNRKVNIRRGGTFVD